MGTRNYLVEGVSGTGKTPICTELQRRGYQAANGDAELAYQGDPQTGEPLGGIVGPAAHDHHIWRVDGVKALLADHGEPVTFFCGGSGNFATFLDLFDGVFVLEVDSDTLRRRLDERPENEWGGRRVERDLIERLHRTKEDIPRMGTLIDDTAPITLVVDDILRHVAADRRAAT